MNKYKLKMKTSTGLGNEYVYVYATNNFERYLNIHKLGYARDITKDYQLANRFEEIQQENQHLKDRIVKAIEFIKGSYEMACYTKSICLEQEQIEELLEILR